MAHRLISGVAPNCSIPHGHDEVVKAEVVEKSNRGLDGKTNMLVEFSQVKGRWFEWIDKSVDHSFHLGDSDPLISYFQQNEPEMLAKILVTPGDPTTEIRAACYAAKLGAFLAKENPDYGCLKMTIQETPTNAVEFRPSLGRVVEGGAEHWWNRPDLSINNFSEAA
ncbi:MAG: 6-carboxytetrahydropterin synthase [Verrucomicrobiales bacterium]|nr:6-carboxytetrahydropterin synthase [Verrucomicrobiales bacterium]